MTGKATFRGSCCQKVLGALRSYTLAGGLVAIVCSQVSNASAFVPKQALGNDISAETLQRRGAQYLRDSRFANAETAYRAALQIDPKLWESRMGLGIALAQQKEYPAAEEQLRGALAEGHSSTDLLMVLGSVQLSSKEFSRAEETFRRALSQDPTSARILDDLAHSLYEQKKYTAALHFWTAALALQPGDPALQLSIATTHSELGALDEALIETRSIVEQNPFYESALFTLAGILCRKADYPAGIEIYRRALLLVPSDNVARRSLGKALLSLQRFGEALPEFEDDTQANPESAEAHFLLGKAYRGLGNLNAAEEEFQRAYQLDHEMPFVEGNLGATLVAEGRMSDALPNLDRAIARNAKDSESHFQRLKVYRAIGNKEAAREEGKAVAELNREEVEHDRLAMLLEEAKKLERRNDLSGAISLYKRALEIDSRNTAVLYGLALIEDRLGTIAEEKRTLTIAEKVDSNLPAIHKQLGVAEIRLEEYANAEVELKLALEHEPLYPAAIGNLGVVYAATGRKQNAIAAFSRAIELDPEYEQAHRNLGILLVVQGEIMEAKHELTVALSIDPKDTVAEAAISHIRAPIASHR